MLAGPDTLDGSDRFTQVAIMVNTSIQWNCIVLAVVELQDRHLTDLFWVPDLSHIWQPVDR